MMQLNGMMSMINALKGPVQGQQHPIQAIIRNQMQPHVMQGGAHPQNTLDASNLIRILGQPNG